jgi:hypothetical protein
MTWKYLPLYSTPGIEQDRDFRVKSVSDQIFSDNAKHLSLESALFPTQFGISTILPAPRNKKISSMLKLKPGSNAAARM